jgi:diguanylate cyclase (GGDEF)-like protein
MGNISKVKNISAKHAEEILTKYKKTFQVDLINEIKKFGRINNLDQLCKHTQKVINRYLFGSDTIIYIINEKTHTYQYKGDIEKINGKPKEISENNYFINYLKQQEGIIAIDSLQRATKEAKINELSEALEVAKKLKSNIIIPLSYIEFLGFISIENQTNNENPYQQDHFMLLDFLGDKLSSSISNISLNIQANTDSLTSLSNQRYLQKRGREEILLSLRYAKPISLLLIDVDKFKNLNDKFGYEEGNVILSAVAECISSTHRASEECFRYGGEEFIVLAHLDDKGAKMLAERINNAFKTNAKILSLQEKYKGMTIRVSIGVSTFVPKEINKYPMVSETSEIFGLLKNRSNQGLKQAKKQGRDRVCMTKTFDNIKNGKNMDDFVFDIAIITKNSDHKNIKLKNNNLVIVNEFDESKIKYCDCIIFDISDKSNISNSEINFDFIDKFDEGNRIERSDKHIAIISEDKKHKKICDEKGYEYFLMPVVSKDIEKWLNHIKIKNEKK